ncbi:hypothetical protein DL546_005844 [Coniochaeta pulveracea]|uniref:Myb-like domain-containing protein n=1 Tax=Coniochaeta pulveracea TaxID=177199 RepID=A0A420Y3N6_9PEZI|nr:hypothetical protein DL546_005844 [Coniochaeta pulveracea]
MPSKFTRQDLKDGKARVSVLSWMAGLDPVVPAKKSTNRPKRGWFSSRTNTKYADKYYDADESSSGDDSDASIAVVKKDGHKSILKNGAIRAKPSPGWSRKANAPGKKHKVVLDSTSDESEDGSSTDSSETSSESEAAPIAQPMTAIGGDEDSPSESTSAVATTEAETTDAETSAVSDGVPAAPVPTPVSGPTTDGGHAASLDIITTGDEATQTEPLPTHDETVQATPAPEETPAEAAAPAPTQPVMPAVEEAQPTPTDPDWTPSLDAILTAMKQGGESWRAIAAALGKSKKDIVARWKLLVKNKNANSTSAAGPSALPPAPVPSPAALAVNTMEVPSRASPTKTLSPFAPSSKRSKQSKGKGKARGPSSGLSVDEAMEAGQIHEEEMRGMLEHLYSAYSDQYSSRIRPDAAFSELDCRVLSLLNAKIRAEKWLSLQAAFYNVTGRMVPVALLRERMGDGSDGGE